MTVSRGLSARPDSIEYMAARVGARVTNVWTWYSIMHPNRERKSGKRIYLTDADKRVIRAWAKLGATEEPLKDPYCRVAFDVIEDRMTLAFSCCKSVVPDADWLVLTKGWGWAFGNEAKAKQIYTSCAQGEKLAQPGMVKLLYVGDPPEDTVRSGTGTE